MTIPADFLWAASTSAYQFEAASQLDGKGLSIQDVRHRESGLLRDAMDHYHHMEEDIELLHELGLKGYRFSIAWTRIIPDGDGLINPKGIEFYHRMIQKCLSCDIQPIVTLYHDDLPYELERKGGWSNRNTIDAFVRYCSICFQEYGPYVSLWQPICEQNLLTIEQIVKKENSLKQAFQANHHMFIAQAKVFKLFHDMKLPGKIGPALNIVKVYPFSSSPSDSEAADQMNMLRNLMYLDVAVEGKYSAYALSLLKKLDALPEFEETDELVLSSGTCDVISFSCYTSVCVTKYDGNDFEDTTGMKYGFNLPGMFKIVPNPNLGYTQFASEVDPIGTRLILTEVYQRYKRPILSIQRGYGCKEDDVPVIDDQRIDYLRLQIEQLHKTIENGVDLLGYCTWSAFDVISTSSGVDKRYGLIHVQRTNESAQQCIRTKKASFYWYQKIIQTNGVA
ncbi:MAG: glycoside hydrolase family 1 protein [Erysipelotrichaceae bacterium]|nr:glycoside hydrolase family 1 protein [Erysipelotrichaceae bacterium]